MNNITDLNHNSEAIENLQNIRDAITISEKYQRGTLLNEEAIRAIVIGQIAALISALILLYFEVSDFELFTREIILSRYDESFQWDYLSQVAMFLMLAVGSLYYPVWLSSRRSQENFSQFVDKRLSQMKLMSFISDLGIKFGIFSVLILSGGGEYMAALLSLFLLDYVLQKRYFLFSQHVQVVMSFLCIAFCYFILKMEINSLSYPLILFSFLSVLSITKLFQELKKIKKD